MPELIDKIVIKSRKSEGNRLKKKEPEQEKRIKNTLEEKQFERGSLDDYIYNDPQKGRLTMDEYEMLNWRKRRYTERAKSRSKKTRFSEKNECKEEKNTGGKLRQVRLKVDVNHSPSSSYSTFLSLKSSSKTPRAENPLFKPLHLFSDTKGIPQSSIRSTSNLEKKLSQKKDAFNKQKNTETLHHSSQQKSALLTLSSSTIPVKKRKVGRPKKVKFRSFHNSFF